MSKKTIEFNEICKACSACMHFLEKDNCWKRWDKEFT